MVAQKISLYYNKLLLLCNTWSICGTYILPQHTWNHYKLLITNLFRHIKVLEHRKRVADPSTASQKLWLPYLIQAQFYLKTVLVEVLPQTGFSKICAGYFLVCPTSMKILILLFRLIFKNFVYRYLLDMLFLFFNTKHNIAHKVALI